jgi:N utilization substance protein B
MQILYAVSKDDTFDHKNIVSEYRKRIDISFELLLFSVYNVIEIAKHARVDDEQRRKKHLPSDIDKIFIPKLCDNHMIDFLVKNKLVQKKFENYKFSEKGDKDHYAKIYAEFVKEQAYTDYILNTSSSADDDLEILLELFRFCRKNEMFNEIMEDYFANWEDDKSVIIGTFKKILKELPSDNTELVMTYYPDAVTCDEYGLVLLERTFKDDQALSLLINPLLKNWEADRVAAIDMILLKMAATEFMHCPSIPVKVTLNEYIELAKTYSTSKSKEFVNGILEALSKQLMENGAIKKEGRGLIDE